MRIELGNDYNEFHPLWGKEYTTKKDGKEYTGIVRVDHPDYGEVVYWLDVKTTIFKKNKAMAKKNGFKDKVLEECKKGNIIVAGIDGYLVAPVKEFIKQPVEGILYDLNRDVMTILTFIDNPKWVNDYAVMKVIIELKKRIKELEEKLTKK